MKTYIVYRHTSPTGKIYIGITNQQPQKRWKNGLGYSDNPFFYNAIKKYGWENFTHEILYESLSAEDACRIEEELIAKHKSYEREYGYNIALGGEANKPTEQTKQKISLAVRSKWENEEYKKKTSQKMRGLKRSAEGRQNIGAAQKKRFENPEERKKVSEAQIGKKRTESAKQKTSESLKQYYANEENIERMRKIRAVSNRMALGKKVLCVETGAVYETISDAAAEMKIQHSNISYVCKGKRKTAGGYHWAYV